MLRRGLVDISCFVVYSPFHRFACQSILYCYSHHMDSFPFPLRIFES